LFTIIFIHRDLLFNLLTVYIEMTPRHIIMHDVKTVYQLVVAVRACDKTHKS